MGFGLGARVVVEEAEYDYEGEVFDEKEIPATVVGHLTDHVQLWLDSETLQGKRWIRLRPKPREPSGSIGVRPTYEQGDIRAAKLEMVRGAAARKGSPVEALYWCGKCLGWYEECLVKMVDGRCPGCGSTNLERHDP